MRTELSFAQTRVIGALIEKEVTTPDQYPLSLNSLTLACNQKSNREPVVNFSELEVQQTLDELSAQGLMFDDAGAGGRVARYKHRFCNTQFGDLQLSEQELAIICVLFLRGPQTPGELRTRTNRLCTFNSVQQVEQVLEELMQKDDPLVCRLAKEPGKREARYAHLFSGEVDNASLTPAATIDAATDNGQIAQMQQQIDALRVELDEIKQWISQQQ